MCIDTDHKFQQRQTVINFTMIDVANESELDIQFGELWLRKWVELKMKS